MKYNEALHIYKEFKKIEIVTIEEKFAQCNYFIVEAKPRNGKSEIWYRGKNRKKAKTILFIKGKHHFIIPETFEKLQLFCLENEKLIGCIDYMKMKIF